MGQPDIYCRVESPLTEIGDGSITLTVPYTWLSHCFAAVRFYKADGTKSTPVSGGTLVFTVETTNIPGEYMAITGGSVVLTGGNAVVNWNANTQSVKVTGLGGVSADAVTHAKLIVSCNAG